MHDTVKRLYLAATRLKNVEGPSAVARLLNESPQTVKNWESRGLSHKGAIRAASVLGVTTAWLMDGIPAFMSGSQAALLDESLPNLSIGRLTAEEKPSASYRDEVAHPVSLSTFDTPPTIEWGEVMQVGELPPTFVLTVEDEALAGHYNPGTRIVFSCAAPAKVGRPVIVQDKGGARWLRLYGNVRGEHWQAMATGVGYPTLDSVSDQLEVVASAIWIEA